MKVKFLKSAALTAFLAASLSFAQANTAPATTVAPQGGAGGCAAGSALVDGQCVVTTTVAPVTVAQAEEATGSVPTEGTDPVAPTATLEEVDTVTMVVGNFERQVAEVEAALAEQLANQNKPEPQPVPKNQPNPGTETPNTEVPEVGSTNSDAKVPEDTVENPGQSNPNPNSDDNPEPKAKPLPTDGDGTNDGEEKVGEEKDGDEKTVTNDQDNKNKSETGAVEDQEKGDQQLTKEKGDGEPKADGEPKGEEETVKQNHEDGLQETPPAPPASSTVSSAEPSNGQQDGTGNGNGKANSDASELEKQQQDGTEHQDAGTEHQDTGSGKSLGDGDTHSDPVGGTEALQQDPPADPPAQPQGDPDSRVPAPEEHREDHASSEQDPKTNTESESKPSVETSEKGASLDPEPKSGSEKLEPNRDEEGEEDEDDEAGEEDEAGEDGVTHVAAGAA